MTRPESAEKRVSDFIAGGILQVSPVGSVWRVKKKIGGQAHRLVSISPVRAEKEMPNGRLQIQVYRDGKRLVCASHRLIWYLFNGEIPEKHHIHHKNEDRQDNRISNLECLSAGDHVRRHAKDRVAWTKGIGGTERAAQWHAKTVKSRKENHAIRCAETHKLWKDGLTQEEVGRTLGISRRQVCSRLRSYRRTCADAC